MQLDVVEFPATSNAVTGTVKVPVRKRSTCTATTERAGPEVASVTRANSTPACGWRRKRARAEHSMAGGARSILKTVGMGDDPGPTPLFPTSSVPVQSSTWTPSTATPALCP